MTTTMREVPHFDSVPTVAAAASNPTGTTTTGSFSSRTRHELARVA